MTEKAAQRMEALNHELERVLDILRRCYTPKLIYIYGSLATGIVKEWSDIDLVIVKDTSKRFLDRTAEVLDLISPRVGMDIVVYTPKEWETMLRERRFVQEEIVQKGKILYAA